ncbi:MAG: hypothetical protein ACREDY_11585, partial [Bradyrhizobium sp.]
VALRPRPASEHGEAAEASHSAIKWTVTVTLVTVTLAAIKWTVTVTLVKAASAVSARTLDLPCAGGAAVLLDAVGVHGRTGAPVPQIAAARRERVRSLDPDIAGAEREGVAALDAVPLERLQKELRYRCIALFTSSITRRGRLC